MAKTTGIGKRAMFGAVAVGAIFSFFYFSGCNKKDSRTAGKDARETYEKSKEVLKEGLTKTGEVAKEGLEKGGEAAKVGLEKSKEAAKEFSKGWKEGGK